VVVTGKKETEKSYTRYSGFPGGLREVTVAQMRVKKPQEIIRHAVSGMLPKNKLRDQWLTRLYVYPNEKHPYGEQLGKVSAKGGSALG
jgi:large subunit ribosomal protein L13